MKPVNTFSSELLRKVSKSDSYNGLNSDQVLLSILRNPIAWYSEPIIYIKRGNDMAFISCEINAYLQVYLILL